MRRLRSRSVLLDVYAAFVRPLGNWIAVADLVRLMAALDVDEQAVRSSVSRFTRRGLLLREVRRDQVGYALSERALDLLAEGDLRIYDGLEPARLEDGWALATFSIPEEARAERHQLRTRLTWLGYGNVGAGLWIAPRRVLDRTLAMVAELGLEDHVDVFVAHYAAFDDVGALVGRCWDLDRLREVYRDFLATTATVLEGRAEEGMESGGDRADDTAEAAFADYVAVLHEWRKLPYLDPGLPRELLPEDWEGAQAAERFAAIRSRLEGPARRYVEEIVATSRRPV